MTVVGRLLTLPAQQVIATCTDHGDTFMHRFGAIAIGLLLCVSTHAASPAAGRWEGVAQVPGFDLHVTVDLDRDSAGAWTGSIIIPELDIAGATLKDIAQKNSDLTFRIADVLVDAKAGPAGFTAHLGANQSMAGTFTQAGNTAPFTLTRTGAAQVSPPAHSTPVAKALEGKWVGEYELGGYPRQVTITLANHEAAPATAEFIIVGKKTNNLPVDMVTQDGDYLRIESHQFGINFEGRVLADKGEIDGICQQGPFEPALRLHRATEVKP